MISNIFLSDNEAKFNFNNFLTNSQQTAFYNLDPRIKEIIMSRLLISEEPQDLTKVRLTLDIVVPCPENIHGIVNLFFLTAFNEKCEIDINPELIKLREICQLDGGAKAFFKCASTKKLDIILSIP